MDYNYIPRNTSSNDSIVSTLMIIFLVALILATIIIYCRLLYKYVKRYNRGIEPKHPAMVSIAAVSTLIANIALLLMSWVSLDTVDYVKSYLSHYNDSYGDGYDAVVLLFMILTVLFSYISLYTVYAKSKSTHVIISSISLILRLIVAFMLLINPGSGFWTFTIFTLISIVAMLLSDKIDSIFNHNPQQPHPQPDEKLLKLEELKKYKELLDMGVIVQEEFERMKAILLNGDPSSSNSTSLAANKSKLKWRCRSCGRFNEISDLFCSDCHSIKGNNADIRKICLECYCDNDKDSTNCRHCNNPL